MPAPLLSRRDLEFYLYEMFNVEALTSRERYADHNRESFNAALDIAEKIAQEFFLPIRAKVDLNQPDWDGEKVIMIPEIKRAYDAVAEAGLICPDQNYDMGGMQLPSGRVRMRHGLSHCRGQYDQWFPRTDSRQRQSYLEAHGSQGTDRHLGARAFARASSPAQWLCLSRRRVQA